MDTLSRYVCNKQISPYLGSAPSATAEGRLLLLARQCHAIEAVKASVQR